MELANVMADVRRGIWRSPPADPAAARKVDPTFHEFASEWFEGLRDEGLSPNTLADYEWQLTLHLLPFFAEHRLSEITIAEVDHYRQAKVREGRLSPTSINKTIQRLGQILEVAVERELIDRNPAKGKRRRLKQPRPPRTWLDRADQIAALLSAAGELDAEARADRRASSRRALLSVLTFAGLRISEALALRWSDVDLAVGRLRVRAAKTDTGIRDIDLLPTLREELATYRARARFTAPDDFVFPTESGQRQNASNVRNRALAKSVERANRWLSERDLAPLPEGLTPHSLRRTYASLLIAKGDELPYVMTQLGHADPKMTLGVYAHLMLRTQGERERLRALVEGADWAQMGTNPEIEPSAPTHEPATESENPAISRAFDDGRGWFRTSDLSRVKRALSH
jgi:integrase